MKFPYFTDLFSWFHILVGHGIFFMVWKPPAEVHTVLSLEWWYNEELNVAQIAFS